MTTTETTETSFQFEADLIEAVGKRTELDMKLLTTYDRHRLWRAWRDQVDERPAEDLLTDVCLLAHDILDGCYRPFCPVCGSSDLTELREATAYLSIRSAFLNENPCLMSEQDPERPPSIFETTDLIRCENCDFEVENPQVIYATAGLGAPEKGVNVFRPRVHVAACQMSGRELAAQVHVYDEDWQRWGRVVGASRETIPLTVTVDSDLEAIDRQLVAVAEKVSANLEQIRGYTKLIERDGDPIAVGSLFDELCASVSAELNKK